MTTTSGKLRRRRRADGYATHAVLIGFSILALLPFASIALISFFPADQQPAAFALPHPVSLTNYRAAWGAADLGMLMRNSAIVAVVVVPLTTAVSIMAGYAFGTMRFRGRTVLFYMFLIGLAMPFEAVVVPLYYDERSFGLTDQFAGVILPEAALFLAFGIFWMRSFFQSPLLRVLGEAARIDGANSWQVLWRIMLPAGGRPAVMTLVILFFVWSWNQFLLPLVLLQDPARQTAPAGLGFFIGQFTVDERGIAAAGILITVPVLIVYIFTQRHFINGIMSGSVKG
jgi:raffinose/stachyose/melibiose transport system permease protein